MYIRQFNLLLLVIILIISNSCTKENSSDSQLIEMAKKIHESALTLDTHVDIAGSQYATEKLDPGIDNPRLRCDLVKMNRGRLDGVFLADTVRAIRRRGRSLPDRRPACRFGPW